MFLNPRRLSGSTLASSRLHPNLSSRPSHPDTQPDSPEPAPQADLVSLNDIEPGSVEWLWQDRLAAGTVTVLSGDPGSGKTWVALAIAAALSRGEVPGEPDSSSHPASPCTTLYASNQNLSPELLRSRFLSLAGDPTRLLLLRPPSASSLSPKPAILEDALARTQARLLILDPLHSYLAANDRHRAYEAASLLDNLARLAEEHSCCVLLVRHLRRLGRATAAIELSAAARTEFLVGSSPDAPDHPALVQTKSNLGPRAPSLGYRIHAAAFQWTGLSKLTPEDLQVSRPIGAGLPQRKIAAEWLRHQLSNGPLTQGTIERAAQSDGLSMITVRRAKCDLALPSTKHALNGCWYWSLPEATGDMAHAGAGKNIK